MQPKGDRPVIISFRIEHLLGWGVTVLLCLVPVYLWLQMHPLSTIETFPAIMLSIGRVTGLVGMVMYALNLVYATRWKFLEYFFGGLNRVYIAHHLLGGLSLIMLSLHPLFLALRYVQVSLQQAALLLLPNGLTPVSALFDTHSDYHQIVLAQWAIFLGILAFWAMLILLLVTFFIRIPYHIWLQTHKLLGVAFFLGGLHVLFINSDTSPNGPLKYYIFAITILGLLSFVYKTLAGRILIRKYQYAVYEVNVSGGNVTQLLMNPVRNSMSYKPGQFVFVRFLNAERDGVSKEWHPFSISSAPNDAHLRVSVKALGDFTNTLANLKPGVIAEVEGAYGRFSYTDFSCKNQIWIAGGIGIAPFISMARDIPSGKGYKIDLYYVVKTTSEVIDWKELYDIAIAGDKGFRVIPYIGDKQPGHLDADFVERGSGGVKDKEIFICGPPAMMKDLRKQFKQKLVPGTSIHTEEFGMS